MDKYRSFILHHASLWFTLVLLVANGVAWAYALAPGDLLVDIEPQIEPDLADLRQRLREGGHSGESFSVEVTDLEAAQTIAWYLSNHPRIPFRAPQVSISPGGIEATGVAEIAGLRVPLRGTARIWLHAGVPDVTLVDLDVGGLTVPSFVQRRIQSEIDAQFALAQNLPVSIETFDLQEGKAIVRGTIR
ncbi:MAG: hypothetical protein JXA93_18515 [Anaerolineae bacterium]|nr:hypothetical protein [Anaerolineae bacterium]